ncbi:phage major tail tube protein [uncultured Parasutterella sp.]|uniref:phage major tail tube protein n=1 Tax=uncultured Parasutterella sp. TaxID=1263098 RepID=UPI002599C781|nr:phage major tail tube protein [uncultured Parasutterella sp.]
MTENNGANYIPDRTINFNVTADEGNVFLGIGTVDMPEIQRMTDTLSGSGIAGEVETTIPGHFQSMETTINWSSLAREAFNLLKEGPVSLTLRLAQNEINASGDSNQVKAVRVHLRGLVKTSALGTLEVNAKTEQTTVIETTYLRVFINDEETLEIDKLNLIFKVGGTDQMGDVRKALGMN